MEVFNSFCHFPKLKKAFSDSNHLLEADENIDREILL